MMKMGETVDGLGYDVKEKAIGRIGIACFHIGVSCSCIHS